MAPTQLLVDGVPSNVALLAGPILLGSLFGYGLYGILVVQIYMYSNNFPRDSPYMKWLVWMVFLIDTIITVFGTVAAWNILASGWGNPAVLTPLDWPFTGLPFLSGVVASCLHFFFAWRIWKLRHSLILPISICILSLLSCVMATYSGIATRIVGLPKIGTLKPFVIVWLGGNTLTDVVITVAMVHILSTAKRSTVFQHSVSRVSKLITLTVETGMATALGALSELILFIVFPTNNMHFLPFLMLAKLYSNTILATLNSRASLGKVDNKPALWNDQSAKSITLSGGSVANQGLARGSVAVPVSLPNNGVQISTTIERRDDVEMYPIEKDNHYQWPSKSQPRSFLPH